MNCSSTVSIIVPVYNAERCIERCVRSILSQDYRNIEVILINDGSRDASGEMCRRYAELDSRILFIDQENKGVSATRNEGIERSTGELVCFIDSDDWINSNHISGMVQQLADYDLAVFGYYLNENEIKMRDSIINISQCDSSQMEQMLTQGFIHPCWNKLFRRKIILENRVSFPDKISISEDSIFCLTYLQHSVKVRISSFCSYHYVVEACSDSLSKAFHSDSILVYGQVHELLMTLMRQMTGIQRYDIICRVIFPQIYGTMLKILRSNQLSQELKRKYLDELVDTPYSNAVLKRYIGKTNIVAEKCSVYLLLHKHYRLLEFLWKTIIR